jgi:hypothetical protein
VVVFTIPTGHIICNGEKQEANENGEKRVKELEDVVSVRQ